MEVKCIDNKYKNTNFTFGKIYELSFTGIRCNTGGMWLFFETWNIPKSFDIGCIFEFAMCQFKIIN